MLKRIVSFLLAAILLLCTMGCAGKTAGSDDAMEFVKGIKIGWNLGNSLDAPGSGPFAETTWGNPETTEEMILDIKEMGFNAVRIPTSWGSQCNAEGKVNAERMARVREVVDYAYNNGMYVILNTHHDTDYYDIGSSVESEKIRAVCLQRMETLWKQIAEEFKDYDERLIFETLNEPRDVGSEKEWSGGTPEEREIIYDMNDAIVKVIRNAGGNNKKRYIMVPSYGANADMNVLRELRLPDDPRIIVSVHAYAPYNFAMNPDGSAVFTEQDRKDLDYLFNGLNDLFVSKGVPVIIGEMGVTNKDNQADRAAWVDYYVRGAKKYNIACFVWDNNHGTEIGGEQFGLYNRREGSWYFPELAKAYVDAAE